MSLPRYPEYKDRGVEWLGEIPAHWRLAKIRTFTRFCGGGTPSRENLAYWHGSIPWVSPKDMKAERLSGAEECITEAGLSACASPMIEAGGLLMVVRSGILKHTIPVAINHVAVALNQDMKALRFVPGSATSDFFLRWVQGLNDLLLVAWAKQGATVESLEHSYLAETLMPLPPLEEQAAITTFLDRETAKIDALIAEQEKLLALLAEKRQAAISHAVTRGLDPNAPMKDSGISWLGEVPVHWTVAMLRRFVARFEQGWSPECESRVPEAGEWGVLKAGCVNGGTFNALESKALPSSLQPRPDLEIKGGDVLMSRASGSPKLIGSVAYIEEAPPMLMLSDKIFRLGLSADVDPEFFALLMGSQPLRQQIEQAIGGAEGLANNLPQSSIKDFWICVPAVSEQRAIVECTKAELASLRVLAEAGQRTVHLLTERRSALIAAAVTGQIDVRGAVEPEAA